MGVGKRLLDSIKAYCREAGIKLLFVDASEADQHAVDFYRGAGASGEKVIQFTYLSM
jgi:ribosomal protein S18 acetylase RimI-like enzyme